MKRQINILLLIILTAFFNSCTEEEQIYSTIDDGIYEGTFTIVESNGTIHSGKVTFSFNKSTISVPRRKSIFHRLGVVISKLTKTY